MKAAVRFAFCALGFLTAVSAADAQFKKIRPSNYGVWSPQVGSGAVYQLESQSKTQIHELAIVRTEALSKGTGYWLETRIMTSDQREVVADKRLLVRHGRKLLTASFVLQPSPPKPDAILLDSSFLNIARVTVVGVSGTEDTLIDFRSGATRIGTESVLTPAGTLDCEVWRMKKGGAEVWYSPQVSPFGLVKMESQAGTVRLTKVITSATERMFVVPVDTPASKAAEESAALHGAFPGVWAPVVGSGAAYQLERNGKKQDIELVVTGSESKGSETFHRLEVNTPCAGHGFWYNTYVPAQYSYEYGDPTSFSVTPARDESAYSDYRYEGKCTNQIQITGTGLVNIVESAYFVEYVGYPKDSQFSIPVMLLMTDGSVSTNVDALSGPMRVEVRTSPHFTPKPLDSALADFRKRAVFVGTETITTPAGTFQCEHWRALTGDTDVWLNSGVAPFGIVKKSNAQGDLVLTKVITSPKPRPKVIRRSKAHFKFMDLRPHK